MRDQRWLIARHLWLSPQAGSTGMIGKTVGATCVGVAAFGTGGDDRDVYPRQLRDTALGVGCTTRRRSLTRSHRCRSRHGSYRAQRSGGSRRRRLLKPRRGSPSPRQALERRPVLLGPANSSSTPLATPYPVMQHLDLDDGQTAALVTLLTRTIADDRYPLSPRVRASKDILAKLRPEPVREPLRPPKVYAPP
jgi:hypothetical protein